MKTEHVDIRASLSEKEMLKEAAENLSMKTGRKVTVTDTILLGVKQLLNSNEKNSSNLVNNR
jgi:hypothetical protein